MLTRRHVLPPSQLGGMARHRLVQNARSRSNSKTAPLYPECNQTRAVHGHEHTAQTQPIFMSMGGLQAHVNSKLTPATSTCYFLNLRFLNRPPAIALFLDK